MSNERNVASVVIPPRSGAIQQFAGTTTAVTTALNAGLSGKWVTVYVISGSAYILFGASTVTVDATVSAGPTLGKFVTAGEERQFKLDAADTHIAVDCASGTATIELTKSGR